MEVFKQMNELIKSATKGEKLQMLKELVISNLATLQID
jgi:hypothetical protein